MRAWKELGAPMWLPLQGGSAFPKQTTSETRYERQRVNQAKCQDGFEQRNVLKNNMFKAWKEGGKTKTGQRVGNFAKV